MTDPLDPDRDPYKDEKRSPGRVVVSREPAPPPDPRAIPTPREFRCHGMPLSM
jgi:hypothetical protein